MPKSLRIILFTIGSLIGLTILLAMAVLLFVDINAHKSQLEAAASDALGMEVHVGGRLGILFLPDVHVTLADAHVRNRGAEVASAKEIHLGIELLPLLREEVRIKDIVLNHATISIERDRDGKFNFEKADATGGSLPVLDIPRISLANGTLHYADEQFGGGIEASDCNVKVRRLRLPGGKSAELMRRLSFTAELACGEVRKNDFTMSDVKLSAEGKKGVFHLDPITMRIFGAEGSGSIEANYSDAVPLYQVRYAVPQFHIEDLFKLISKEKFAEGSMNFSANLSMQGDTVSAMTQTVNGEASLRGENLRLYGRDLDRELDRFESSQKFNLVDVGAFFYAGPFGLMLTKGYTFASLLKGSEGTSEIPILVSDWKIEHGVLHAQDVAMATHKHRIALKGKLDFVNDQFDDVTVALIGGKGCVKVQQKISGPFAKPVIEQPSVFKALAGPVIKLLKKGEKLFGGQCEPFYTGSVAAPKKAEAVQEVKESE